MLNIQLVFIDIQCRNGFTCIELIIANKSEYFQNSTVIETGSSDFHKITFTDMKDFCSKHKVNIIL